MPKHLMLCFAWEFKEAGPRTVRVGRGCHGFSLKFLSVRITGFELSFKRRMQLVSEKHTQRTLIFKAIDALLVTTLWQSRILTDFSRKTNQDYLASYFKVSST